MEFKSPPTIRVSLYQVCVLLHNMHVAGRDPKIGPVELQRTLEDVMTELDKRVLIRTDILESALYYSNMLDETSVFWHPHDLSFETFLARFLPSDIKFDKKYNVLYNEKGENTNGFN